MPIRRPRALIAASNACSGVGVGTTSVVPPALPPPLPPFPVDPDVGRNVSRIQPFVATMGLDNPVSLRVGLVLAVAAVLLTGQGMLRWRRFRRARVSA